MTRHLKFVVLAALAGCTASNAPTIAVDSNELGVTHVTIEHERVGSERLTEVHGFDANDREIASLTLHVGDVRTSYDPGHAPEQISLGRELDVTVAGRTAHVVSPDLRVAVHPALAYRESNVFVTLPAVSAELAATGLVFPAVAAPGEGEVGYDYEAHFIGGTNDGCNGLAVSFPSARGSCARSYYLNTRTFSVGTSGVDNVLQRDKSANGVCRNQDGTTGCGAGGSGMCYFGPCGWSNSVTYDYTYVLQYASIGGPTWYDIVLEYSRGQDNLFSWPGVSASCTCTGCNANGVPSPSGCTHD
jgi:hypothetical protein